MYQSVLIWTKHNLKSRVQYLFCLVEQIDWTQISTCDLKQAINDDPVKLCPESSAFITNKYAARLYQRAVQDCLSKLKSWIRIEREDEQTVFYLSTEWYDQLCSAAKTGSDVTPIDNSELFAPDGTKLKYHLKEKTDFILIPAEAWECLVEFFGCVRTQHLVKRQSILVSPNRFMQVHSPLKLRCECGEWDHRSAKEILFDSSMSLTDLKWRVQNSFNVQLSLTVQGPHLHLSHFLVSMASLRLSTSKNCLTSSVRGMASAK